MLIVPLILASRYTTIYVSRPASAGHDKRAMKPIL